MDPLSLKMILFAAFSAPVTGSKRMSLITTTSFDAVQAMSEVFDPMLGSSRNIQIAKFILQVVGPHCRSLQHSILSQMVQLDHDDEEVNSFFEHSMDMNVMRLAVGMCAIDDTVFGVAIGNTAFILLNNSVLSRGGQKRKQLTPSSALAWRFTLSTATERLFQINGLV